MIFGIYARRRPARHRCGLLALTFAFLHATVVQAASFDLDALGALLAGVQQSRSEFVETKTMALLERPMRLQGTLYYRAPDYVRKEVTSPDYESYEIEGDVVRVNNGDGSRELSLDRHPTLRAFAEAFRSTLKGDFSALQRFYEVSVQGSRQDWQLRLTPLDPSMASRVQRIEVDGSGAQLFSVLIVERDGDRSLMRIRPLGD